QRPVELDRLNDFVGEWEFEGEMNFDFLDQPLKTRGTNETHWAGDDWYLISDNIFNMGELGTMHGHETWTYDTHSKKYRSTWTDSMGGTGIGESRYDEASDTWYMKARANTPHGKSTMKGHVKFLDPSTIEWSWNEYMMGGLMKVSSMTGTSRRK
ncbi:MAG: DUF1579 family protein, partial [Planctomycetes bacterium]|nr:DUF1579 family protein [Planctomycetota bacterium]